MDGIEVLLLLGLLAVASLCFLAGRCSTTTSKPPTTKSAIEVSGSLEIQPEKEKVCQKPVDEVNVSVVYVNPCGHAFHKKGCHHLRSQAKALLACKQC